MVVGKKEFVESLSKEAFNAGLIKFNIPDEDNITNLNGEGVWGWVVEEDKEKYNDDSFNGNITAILLNQPLNYYGMLNWADEVVLKCHGSSRPTLDPEWVMENLMGGKIK